MKHSNEQFSGLTSTFLRKIENEIEGKLPAFEQSHTDKQNAFVVCIKLNNLIKKYPWIHQGFWSSTKTGAHIF